MLRYWKWGYLASWELLLTDFSSQSYKILSHHRDIVKDIVTPQRYCHTTKPNTITQTNLDCHQTRLITRAEVLGEKSRGQVKVNALNTFWYNILCEKRLINPCHWKMS